MLSLELLVSLTIWNRMRILCSRLVATVLLVVLVGAPTPAFPQPPNIDNAIDKVLGDHTKYKQVISALQQSVGEHDAAGVAVLISYPIKIKIDGKNTFIKTKQAFINNYDKIITPAIASVIRSQKYEDLTVNYQGIMFGRGEVWINGICLDNFCKKVKVKVVTIQDSINLDTKR